MRFNRDTGLFYLSVNICFTEIFKSRLWITVLQIFLVNDFSKNIDFDFHTVIIILRIY